MDEIKKESDKIVAMLVSQLNKKPEDVKMTSRIKEDLNADSLDLVELIMKIEDDYKISLPDEAVLEIKTVGDVVALVEKIAKAK